MRCKLPRGGYGATSPIPGEWPTPALDRWMYPFNPTPGTRPTISTFGSTPGAPEFDSRDGQMIVGFTTTDQIPPGLEMSRYFVHSARLTLQTSNGVAIYDESTDPWTASLASSAVDGGDLSQLLSAWNP